MMVLAWKLNAALGVAMDCYYGFGLCESGSAMYASCDRKAIKEVFYS